MNDDNEKVSKKEVVLTSLRFAETNGFNKVNKFAFLKMVGGANVEKTTKEWEKFCKDKFILNNNK